MRELLTLVGAGAVLGAVAVLVLLRLGMLQRIDVRLVLAGIVIGFVLAQWGHWLTAGKL